MSRNELSLFETPFTLLDPFFDPFFYEPTRRDAIRTDIIENKDSYELLMDVPGITKDEITIDVANSILTITIESKEKNSEGKVLRRERNYFKTTKQYELKNLKEEDVTAKLENGVLTVTVMKPKKAEIISKRIEIQ